MDSANQNLKKTPLQSVSEDEPSQDDFIEIDEEPRPLQNIQQLIKYPEEARRAGLEGKVTCSLLIGKDGDIKRIHIDKADNDIFREPVIEALKKVRYSSARKDGKPVAIWLVQSVIFKIPANEDEQDHH